MIRRIVHRFPEPLQRIIGRFYYPILVKRAQNREPDIRGLGAVVESGDLVVDAGANIGVYTYALSKLAGITGQVHSFEPVPTTAAILRQTVERCGLHNVVVHEQALSSRAGTADIHTPIGRSGRRNIYRASLVTDGAPADLESVEKVTLDSALPSRPAFIKIDVEGHELDCLLGATGSLAKLPILLVEIDGHRGGPSNPHDHPTVRFLEDLGYHTYWFDGDTFILHSREHPTPSVNFWFFPAS